MIKANFRAYASYVTDSLHQWDLNQVLQVSGLNLTTVPEVHFSNANTDRAIVRQATMVDHVVSVAVPNSLLQEPLRIYAHIGIYEGDTFKTVELVEIPVIPRKRPADYQIQDSDEEIYSFKAIENQVTNLAHMVDDMKLETGTSAGWDYVKYSNGVVECSREYTATLSKTLDFAGLCAYSVEVPLPTDLFIDEPYFVTHTAQIGTAVTFVGMAEPWPHMVKLWAMSIDGTHNTKWRIIVKGKWR
jgi:hypothetical protein